MTKKNGMEPKPQNLCSVQLETDSGAVLDNSFFQHYCKEYDVKVKKIFSSELTHFFYVVTESMTHEYNITYLNSSSKK